EQEAGVDVVQADAQELLYTSQAVAQRVDVDAERGRRGLEVAVVAQVRSQRHQVPGSQLAVGVEQHGQRSLGKGVQCLGIHRPGQDAVEAQVLVSTNLRLSTRAARQVERDRGFAV